MGEFETMFDGTVREVRGMLRGLFRGCNGSVYGLHTFRSQRGAIVLLAMLVLYDVAEAAKKLIRLGIASGFWIFFKELDLLRACSFWNVGQFSEVFSFKYPRVTRPFTRTPINLTPNTEW